MLFLAGLSTAALIAKQPFALLSLLAIALVMLLAGGVKPFIIWKKMRALFGLIVMLFLLQCLFNRSGEPLLVLSGVVVVTDAGFFTSVTVCLRLLIVILSALVVSIGETRDYLLALTQCKAPYEIAFMVLAALRFLPMLREEARDVLCAAQLRGMKLKKTSLRKQAGAYTSLVIPVVAGAIRRAEHLSTAMEARAFRAFPKRTSMRKLQMRASDWAYVAVFFMVLAGVLVVFYMRFW